jgi:uncharacterized membrane protein
VGVDISTEVVINRPVDEVAAYAADPDNAPTWYVNITSVEWLTPRVIEVGARIAFVARFLGRRMAYTYEIVEFAPSTRLVMRTAEGPFPMETTYIWEAAGPNATRMTLRNRGNPSGFSRSYAPLVGRAMRKANEKDLASLKRKLESR